MIHIFKNIIIFGASHGTISSKQNKKVKFSGNALQMSVKLAISDACAEVTTRASGCWVSATKSIDERVVGGNRR